MANKHKTKKNKTRKNKIRQQKHQDRLRNQWRKSKKTRGKRMMNMLSERPKLTEKMFPDDLHRFWVVNGINYLVSDYGNGVWEPLFPQLYDDDSPVPSPKDVAAALTQKFVTQTENGRWPKQGQASLAWSVINREVSYVYYLEAVRRLKDAYKDSDELGDYSLDDFVTNKVKEPANSVVWGVFQHMIDNIQTEQDEKNDNIS